MENEDEYTQIAGLYYEDFQKYEVDELAYSFGESGKIFCHNDVYEHELILDMEQTTACETIFNSYYLDDNYVERVYVYDKYVSFCNIIGRESLVYSVDGTKPSYVNSPDDRFERIKVMKITDNWYYVRGRD